LELDDSYVTKYEVFKIQDGGWPHTGNHLLAITAACCPLSVKFFVGKQFFIEFWQWIDTPVFLVFVVQFMLRQAAPFVSSLIHLFEIITGLVFMRNTVVRLRQQLVNCLKGM